MKDRINLGWEFLKKNKLITFIFIISTLFFLVQHYFYLAWDFAAYVINAEYLFYGGDYYEVYRAPMVSLLLGVCMVFGKLGEYLYILFVSGLFLYGNVLLSRTLHSKYFKDRINQNMFSVIFYFFSLSPFVLNHGIVVGTELLSLCFFEMFLANYLLKKSSGHLLGLAILSRYNFMIFLPFLLFNKDYKKVLRDLGLAALVIFPWLIFNWIKWGNFFASIIDSYHLNIAARMDRFQDLQWEMFIEMAGVFLVTFLGGVLIWSYSLIRNGNRNIRKAGLIFIATLLFLFIDFNWIPFKDIRYLFNFSLPIAFFSTIFLMELIKKKVNLALIIKIIFIVGVVISVIFLSATYYKNYSHDKDKYISATQKIEELGLKKCEIISSYWVPVNYYSGNIRYNLSTMSDIVNNDGIYLVFPCCTTMDDKFTMEEVKNYPYLYKDKDFILLGKEGVTNNTCKKKQKFDEPLTKDPCEVISKRFEKLGIKEIAYKACNIVNFK